MNRKESVIDKLKEYAEEVDSQLRAESKQSEQLNKDEVDGEIKNLRKEPEIVIIDVENAQKISGKRSKLNSSIGKTFKAISLSKKTKKKKQHDTESNSNNVVQTKNDEKHLNEEKPRPKLARSKSVGNPSPKIQETIENLLVTKGSKSTDMIHSSQQPVTKLPLTKGQTVNTMVKRLSRDAGSPPPKTSVMISPSVSAQHNKNQPFSYTRGVSPDKQFQDDVFHERRIFSSDGNYDEDRYKVNSKYVEHDSYNTSPDLQSPVIYAQVVCGQNGTGPTKQTVHAVYANGKKQLPHSDSDEGLGYEENFSKKYEFGQTHYGDDLTEANNKRNYEEYENPITPKFKQNYQGYGYEETFLKRETNGFVDSSSRGRGDGMDAKRRESLTEAYDNYTFSKIPNNRSDLTARRDQLESRINRRFGDKLKVSPENNTGSPTAKVYISESTSKYYRNSSNSPVGYEEKYVFDSKTDRHDESRSKKYFGEDTKYKKSIVDYRYNNFENEPKSLDSQISDYRSSQENLRHSSHNTTAKYENKEAVDGLSNKDIYKSNPEIHHRVYDYKRQSPEAYHGSLKRDKYEERKSSRYYGISSERKDKLIDSGIENDYKRDKNSQNRDYLNNESEDEGFASSLLIANERQHADENSARKYRREYDLGNREYVKDHRGDEKVDYKIHRSTQKVEYIPRERSIDDGSHYDPRLDKDVENKGSLKKIMEKKPPKPEKKSGLEKVCF